MSNPVRIESESKTYHVVTKGMGGQLTFEDDDDRQFFLRRMEEYGEEERISFYAWCLMTNHVHLVVESEIHNLSQFMMRLESSYVQIFNRKHARKGALFQKGFWSEPILSDEHLLAAVRYVHQNPLKPGLATTCAAYRWSSYREYIGSQKFTDTGYLLDILGSLRNFREFHHEQDGTAGFLDVDMKGLRRTSAEALLIAQGALGEEAVSGIAALERQERDEQLRVLKSLGLSIRQIAMITGIGRNIIARA